VHATPHQPPVTSPAEPPEAPAGESTTERARRVDTIPDVAIDVPQGDQTAFVDHACATLRGDTPNRESRRLSSASA
jgi:hypothetical protein